MFTDGCRFTVQQTMYSTCMALRAYEKEHGTLPAINNVEAATEVSQG